MGKLLYKCYSTLEGRTVETEEEADIVEEVYENGVVFKLVEKKGRKRG